MQLGIEPYEKVLRRVLQGKLMVSLTIIYVCLVCVVGGR